MDQKDAQAIANAIERLTQAVSAAHASETQVTWYYARIESEKSSLIAQLTRVFREAK